MNLIKQKGVTLVELVIVMIVFSILAVPLSNGFLSVSKSLIINEEVKAASNLARACAEHILYQRRNGASTFLTTDCNGITGFLGSATLTITPSDSTTNAPLCPVPANLSLPGPTICDEIVITANNSGGQSRSTMTLFFAYNP